MSVPVQSAPAVGVIDENNLLTLNWQPFPGPDGAFDQYTGWDIRTKPGASAATTITKGAALNPGETDSSRILTLPLISSEYKMNMRALASGGSPVADNSDWWTPPASDQDNGLRAFPAILGPSSVTLDNTTVLLGQPLQVTLNPTYTGADQWQVIWPDSSSTGWLPLTSSVVAKTFSSPGAQFVVIQTRRDYSSSLYNPPSTLIRQLSIQIFVMDQQASTAPTANTGLSSTLGFAGTEGFEIIDTTAALVSPEPWEVIARGIVRDTVTNELKLLIATSRFSNASSLQGTMAVDVFPIEGRPHVKELLTPVFEIITNANTSSVPVKIQTSVLPDLIVGKSVNDAIGGDLAMTVKTSTGVPNFIWNATGLPAGLVMGTNGIISGVPLEMGFFEVTFSVMDSGQPFSIDELTLSLLIKTDLQVKKHNQPATDTDLGTHKVGVPYSQQMDVGNIVSTSPLPGGLPPYKWSLPAGALPIGLSIDPDSGLLSGTPCTYNSTSDFFSVSGKIFSVVIQVSDAIGAKASSTFSMKLAPADLQFGPLDQTTIFAGQQFKLVVPVFGGRAPYTLTGQTNDAGATPVLIDGQIQTTLEYGPSATGTHTIFFEITDAAATIVQKAFSYKVGVQISSVRWEKGFVDHIWADAEATSSAPIPIPVDADFSGLALDSFSGTGSNTGLTITVDNVYKTASITNAVAASGTYTMTAVNTFIAGDNVYLSGLTGAYASLNGTTQEVLASGLSGTQFKFTTGLATAGSLAQTATAQKLQNFFVSGPKSSSLFVYDDYSRVPIILKSGGNEVARISRAYTLLSHDISAFSPGDVGIVNNLTHPYIVGDIVGLNPRSPFFNSPDLAAFNSLWTVRVKAGSALLPGLSLDSVTGLVYGKLLGTVVGLISVLEYVDATGTLHGTLTLSWSIAVPQTQTTSTFVDGLLGTTYSPVGNPGDLLGPLGAVLAPSQTTLTSVAFSGILPNGLSFALDSVNNRGVVTGAPTEAGYFDVWLQVTGGTKSAFVYQRVVVDYLKPLTILNTDLPTISAQAYSVTLQGFGGAPPYTAPNGGWSSAQFQGPGTTPTHGVGTGNFLGLFLDSNGDGTGTLAGTLTSPPGSSPTPLGSINFVLADQRGLSASVFKDFPLVYNNRLRILTPLNGIASINPDGLGYAFAMQAAGGVPPYSWKLTTPGSPQALLPTGISFETENAPSPYDATAGQFSGATNDTGYGSSSFTILVHDSSSLHTGDSADASGSFLVVVATPVLTIDDSLAGPIPRGEVYLGTLTLVGPAGFPATWQVSPVPSFPLNLPAGLSLHANGSDNGLTAAITGTYSGAPFSNYRVRVIAVDKTGQTAVKVLSLNSGTNLAITTTSLPNPTEPSGSYSFQMESAGGVAPFTWSWNQSHPFHGLDISSSGLISGTATVLFNQDIIFTVTDSLGNVATKTLNLTSQPVGLAITTSSIIPAISGRAYTPPVLQAILGTQPYSWSISPLSANQLPAGLALNGAGFITGTSTLVTSLAVTFRVTDATSAYNDRTLTVSVINGLTLTSGIDYIDGTNTDIIGYIVHGQPDSLTRPNLSFYIIATGVVSTSIGQITNVNAGPGPAGGFNAVVSNLDVANGVASIRLSGSGWGAAPVGSNSITISLTDSGTSIAKTFTWVVYDDGTLRLAPTSGSLPIQSVQ